jgi:hypothetical protein
MPSELVGQVISGQHQTTTPSPCRILEPLPWDMVHTKHVVLPITHLPPMTLLPIPAQTGSTFSMTHLLAALPDPMVLEPPYRCQRPLQPLTHL